MKENTQTTAGEITNRLWLLSEIDGKKVHNPLKKENSIHFLLEDKENTISGFSGCNAFHGTFSESKDNGIHFSGLVSTRAACPPALKPNEAEFFAIFRQTNYYQTDGISLTLHTEKASAPLAVFVAN